MRARSRRSFSVTGRASFSGLCALGFLFGSAPACEPDVQKPCEESCARLAHCGLLPSALGLDESDCAERCTLTTESTRAPISTCTQEFAGTSKQPNSWCEAKGCARLASCLAALEPDARRLLGQGDLDVSLEPFRADGSGNGAAKPAGSSSTSSAIAPIIASALSAAASNSTATSLPASATDCEGNSTSPPEKNGSAGLEGSGGADWCASMNATEVEFVLQALPPLVTPSSQLIVPCAQAFDESIEHHGIATGVYRAYARVRGVFVNAPAPDESAAVDGEPVAPAEPAATMPEPSASADGGAPALDTTTAIAARMPEPFTCFTLHGESQRLLANQTHSAVIALPDWSNLVSSNVFPCEEGAVFCTDGVDNDKNDLADCAESACSPFCPTSCDPAGDAGCAPAP